MRPEFLNGPFAPWAEESEAYDLEVVGKIPEDLAHALFLEDLALPGKDASLHGPKT
jgi:carotenoid cleavage dioxygenase-like enzyme